MGNTICLSGANPNVDAVERLFITIRSVNATAAACILTLIQIFILFLDMLQVSITICTEKLYDIHIILFANIK